MTDVTNQDLYNLLQGHFEDDKVAFTKIDKRLDKNEEIYVQGNDHMSHIRKDLTEVNKKIVSLTETLSNHITAVEPILTNYQDTQATYRTFGRMIKPVVSTVLTLASLIGAWFVIKSL